MSAPPYIKFYPADYFGDTYHLTTVEHGAYLLLILAMWQAGGTLPSADANLARLARCTPEEWAAVRGVIMPFFRRRGGRITHKRIAAEMAKYENTSGKRSEAGKRGASEKARKNNASLTDFAYDAESNCTHNQNQNQKEEREANASPKKPVRRKPETPLPVGYPDIEAIATAEGMAREAGVALNVPAQAARFANHAAQNDRRCRDWSAAWRNWIIGALEKAPPVRAAGGGVDWV